MFRPKALLAAAAVLIGVSAANADFITNDATFNSLPTVNNVNQVFGSSTGGFIFSNTTLGQGGAPGQTRPIVSVGADLLNTGTGYGQVGFTSQPALFNNGPIVAVFATTGTVTAGLGGLTTTTVTGGRAAFFALPPGTPANAFVPTNPLTWGATNSSGVVTATPLAVFEITNPQNINLGPNAHPASGPVPGATVNTIGLNTINPTLADGIFLLRELAQGNPGANFMNVNMPPLGPNQFVVGEGIEAALTERLATLVGNPFQFVSGGPGTGGFDALNNIAAFLGLPDLVAGGPITPFATAFGVGDGSGTSFDPNGGPSAGISPGSGDLATTLGVTAYPGVFINQQFVPEPATMTIFGVMAAGAGVAGVIRRRRAKLA